MFNAIIVDDERPALDVLRLLLEKTGQICVVGAFMSAADALAEMQNLLVYRLFTTLCTTPLIQPTKPLIM